MSLKDWMGGQDLSEKSKPKDQEYYLAKARKGKVCPKKKICDIHGKGKLKGIYSFNCRACALVSGRNSALDLCLPIVAEILKEQDELTNKIAEIFYEQLKGIYAVDPISALEAIKDMIDDRDTQIAELLKRVDELEKFLRVAHECIVIRAGVRNNEEDAKQDREEIDKAITIIEQALKGKEKI